MHKSRPIKGPIKGEGALSSMNRWKRAGIAGVLVALLCAFSISLSGCTGTPSGALLEATTNNAEIVFAPTDPIGFTRYVKVLNPPNGLNIPAELGGASIREGGVIAETNFKVVGGTTPPCTLPGEMLNRGEW